MQKKHNLINYDYSAYNTLRRLIVDHIKPYLKQIGIAVFCMVVAAMCAAYSVNLVQPTIDQIFLTGNRQMLLFLPLMVVITFTIKGIAEYYSNYLIKFLGQRILTDLQIKMYEHLLFADILFIQSQSSGRLISRFTNDISMMRGAVSNLLVGCAKHFLTVIGLIIVMFKLEPGLSCIVFLAFPLAIYPIQKLGKKIRRISGQAQEELANYTSRLDETFQSIKIVKSFLGERIESNRALLLSSNILRFLKKTAKLDALVSPIMEVLSGITVGGLIWYGGLLVIKGETTPGAFFAFITAFLAAYRPFKSLVSLNVNLQEGIAATRRVFNILDTEPIIKDSVNAQNVQLVNPQIIFNNVELKFNNKVALKLINLKIMPGKTTAFVGRSGSGKTSLSNLLVRFYNPTSGQILIDNYDIKDIRIDSLRQQISLVTQDTTLFDTSVAENIAYGNPNATRDQIIIAAKYADAHQFISNLPAGYDTIIGNQGSTLSGGQRQRLAIARAFLKSAAILVWDEATSSLDQNSERLILNSLVNIRENKTTLIITHRLSSIKDVDHIVVMKSGMIFEQGTHSQLMDNKAEYYKLYNKELEEGDK
ncbi:ABC transporter ATP-binding protein [Candidatus Tisiphia endosymbiont of Myopa tessellatipennis]|uniref:ABC transporter ATP-binding protein n=1 Tax=Candidatus Tisiphia endosymbiont of Myopa tessellatipennis TaxID=3066257 RepID=UPI00313B50C7